MQSGVTHRVLHTKLFAEAPWYTTQSWAALVDNNEIPERSTLSGCAIKSTFQVSLIPCIYI